MTRNSKTTKLLISSKFEDLYNLKNVSQIVFNENPYLSVFYIFLKLDEFTKTKR